MSEKNLAIIQSNYIPWKGYFDIINRVDEFVLYDDMQYTRRDWRNRNKIKTPNGLQWLTIPVQVKGKYLQKICETEISDPGWAAEHWQTLRHNYARAKYFDEYKSIFERLYLDCVETYLSKINHRFLTALCGLLGIKTKLVWSMEYPATGSKTERLVSLCRAAGASRYLSGPSARDYLEEDLFSAAGIKLAYMDYSGYREYEQLYPPFEHGVSILDLIFNTGPDAPKYMQSGAK